MRAMSKLTLFQLLDSLVVPDACCNITISSLAAEHRCSQGYPQWFITCDLMGGGDKIHKFGVPLLNGVNILSIKMDPGSSNAEMRSDKMAIDMIMNHGDVI